MVINAVIGAVIGGAITFLMICFCSANSIEEAYSEGYKKGLKEAKCEWHTAADVPRDDKPVLVLLHGRTPYRARFIKAEWYSDIGYSKMRYGSVTHWIEIPEEN